ncbi:substrate-binding domain-containing protein [Rosenbergiella sp. S61]|uniref:Substrate-binding domain-containing protein n=1 Tax=Rosenbergiella gaditana TaxID=2726987 RepID=A0ABS5SXC2_9GAMM|nr:DNA-binding transcriptional regulator CytR [Rosenbergiella gaditana]MBT0724587.1 substrate-binding domain-containing protein [Rosenbergiella gaditana]
MKTTPDPSSATMKAVAIQAGVSTATVSRVFTSPEKVSPNTRQRVEAAAYALGYSSTPLFPRGITPYWRKVMVIIADITDSFYSEIIRGIETQASQQYCLITLFDCAHQSMDRYITQTRGLPEGYDGLIFVVLSPTHRDRSHPIPSVVINEYSSDHGFPTLHIDNLTASFNAVNYLIQCGHQHIACLTGPEELAICQYRRQGYLQALQRHNLPLNPYYIARGDFSFRSGMSAAEHLLKLATPPDAIFCHNDKMALGAMYQAKQLGIVVPRQLSVIGFDDIEESQYADPPLTTISQPRAAQGENAVSLLMTLMEGKPLIHRSYLLETELILRQSTR